MEELTGVCRQETCCVEKALKNGSEEACVKCRDQGAAWDLITAAYNQGSPGDGALRAWVAVPAVSWQKAVPALRETPAPCWTGALANASLEREQGMSHGQRSRGSGQSDPGQGAFMSVPQPPGSADDNVPVSHSISTTQDANSVEGTVACIVHRLAWPMREAQKSGKKVLKQKSLIYYRLALFILRRLWLKEAGQGAAGYAHGHSYVSWGQKWSTISSLLPAVDQLGGRCINSTLSIGTDDQEVTLQIPEYCRHLKQHKLKEKALLEVSEMSLTVAEKGQNPKLKTSKLVWVGRDLKDHRVPPPCHGQGCLPLEQAAQSPIQPGLEHFQGWGIHNFSGNLFQCLTALIVKNFFLISNLNLTFFQFKAITPCPITTCPCQKSLSSFPVGPLQVLEGCYKVSPEPSLLQAEQPQLSQPVFIGEVFQPSDHLGGPPLDLLQQVHVLLMLGAPELDTVLQDTVGFLGCKCTLLGHVELLINNIPKPAFNPFSAQPVFVLGIALTHVQDLALGLIELHDVCTGPPLKPVKVPLDGIPSLQCVDCTTQLGVVSKLAEGALNPTAPVTDKDVKRCRSQYPAP
ncbi:hypothetical protein QYF61_000129 [Mycteria americana]|uniref:Uncharacterized protein n=1 Tax=Mycteria americana TaxID=33587 RepID=A0AAN7ML78_MYCAM|nr:hypothetical protein QYF61_000129 [Mycteria americana]